MEKSDPLSFGAKAGLLVDETNARHPAALERELDVVDVEADVMYAGTAPGDEPIDRGVVRRGLQQFDERLAGGEPGNAGTVSVVERNLWKAEDVAVEGKDVVERADGDADMGDPGASTLVKGHGDHARVSGRGGGCSEPVAGHGWSAQR